MHLPRLYGYNSLDDLPLQFRRNVGSPTPTHYSRVSNMSSPGPLTPHNLQHLSVLLHLAPELQVVRARTVMARRYIKLSINPKPFALEVPRS